MGLGRVVGQDVLVGVVVLWVLLGCDLPYFFFELCTCCACVGEAMVPCPPASISEGLPWVGLVLRTEQHRTPYEALFASAFL